MRRFFLRLFNVFRHEKADQEVTREIAAHLALLEDEFRARGMGGDEARRAARLALGGAEQAKELHRDARSFRWLDDARRDFFHSARLLRRNPAFALTAALSLGIGIGANTAIFTVVNALLFRDPPGVAEPDRLVDIGIGRLDGGLNPTSYLNYLDIRQRSSTLAGVYAQGLFPRAMSLGTSESGASAERIFAHFVTTNYFTVIGAVPLAGRLFGTADSDRPGASPIVVLSHRFWSRRFGNNVSILGESIRLNGQPFTVVGVAAEGFHGTGIINPDVWLPLNVLAPAAVAESLLTRRHGGRFMLGGRLRPGTTVAQAADEIDALGRALDLEDPNPTGAKGLRLVPSSLVPGNSRVIGAFVAFLMIIVGLVLAVACANVAGILLARATARRREIAVRLAMGAGRGRVVRQLLTETVILFALGGAVGLILAQFLTSSAASVLPSLPFPIIVTLALDGRVLVFTAALSLAASLLFGLAPALQTTRVDVLHALKDDSRVRAERTKLRSAFVMAQVALSVILVVTAGLFVGALKNAGSTDPGFDPRGVELATLDVKMAGYTDSTSPRFWRELVERVRQLPEVKAATAGRVLPGGFEGIGLGDVRAAGVVPRDDQPAVSWNIVEPGYFATLGIPILQGRDFSATDVAGAPPVAIVGESLARSFWPGENATGKLITCRPGDRDETLVVIGVARDVRASSLIDGLAGSFVYLPLQQHTSAMTANMTIAARSTHGQRITRQIRMVVAAMNPNLAIVREETLEDSMALGLVPQRVVASLSGSLGFVGLLLAAIGIYGVTAYTVGRRTREIGIRIAMGAQRADVIGMVLRQGMRLALAGSAIGLTLAAGVSQVLAGFLFGLPPMHPPTFIGAALLFVTVGLIACYLPARRAAAMDPLTALRHE